MGRRKEINVIRKYFLPIVALAGVIFAIYVVTLNNQPVPASQPVADPARAVPLLRVRCRHDRGQHGEHRCRHNSAGRGGRGVRPSRGRRSRREIRSSASTIATCGPNSACGRRHWDWTKGRLQRLESMPRPEDIPPAEARVLETKASVEDLKSQLAIYESINDKRAMSQEELSRRRYAVQTAQARLAQAESQLALLKAGTWKPDIEIARAEVASAEAQVRQTETNIDRLTIRAPVNGEVLQIKIRAGEYAPVASSDAARCFSETSIRLHVRVDVDENDAWRCGRTPRPWRLFAAIATCRRRLAFVRIEPFVIPKRSLTGDSVERSGHPRTPTGLQLRPQHLAGVCWPADGRVHRVSAAGHGHAIRGTGAGRQ